MLPWILKVTTKKSLLTAITAVQQYPRLEAPLIEAVNKVEIKALLLWDRISGIKVTALDWDRWFSRE